MKGAEGSRRRAPMLVSPRQARSNSKRTGQENFITPVAVSFAAILVTTLILFMIDSYLATEHLVLVYLLPTIFIAVYFGSTIAVLTSFASGLGAAYFLLPPQFSFYVADRLHVAELGFTVLLAVIASKVVGVLTSNVHREPDARRADEVIE
jgi:two-component system, OmpR family, sensor histidine kinase KdpD